MIDAPRVWSRLCHVCFYRGAEVLQRETFLIRRLSCPPSAAAADAVAAAVIIYYESKLTKICDGAKQRRTKYQLLMFILKNLNNILHSLLFYLFMQFEAKFWK